MPGFLRRSVALGVFATLAGPVIGSGIVVLGVVVFSLGTAAWETLQGVFFAGLVVGLPFAAVSGIILAIRAAYTGRVSEDAAIAAAVGATFIVILVVLIVINVSGSTHSPHIADVMWQLFLLFVPLALLSAVSATITRRLFYAWFWPRPAKRVPGAEPIDGGRDR
jgi:hypothetical protein